MLLRSLSTGLAVCCLIVLLCLAPASEPVTAQIVTDTTATTSTTSTTPPDPPPPTSDCTNPLASLDPVALGLDPTVEDPILPPTDDSSPDYSKYVVGIAARVMPNIVGVVLPAYGGYTVSPHATTTPDLNYDVSGCWGQQSGIIVYAQPGLYTLLALNTEPVEEPTDTVGQTAAAAPQQPQVVAANALGPKAENVCFTDPAALARAKAVEYSPLPATVAGGKTGLMIDDTNDKAILDAQKVLDSQKIQYAKVGKANPAVDDMVTNIAAVYNNNAKKAIAAGEIGHGGPSQWTNVGSVFSVNAGTAPPTPSDALKKLETDANGQVDTFDIFSCYVAKGLAPGGTLSTSHVMTHLASFLVKGAASVKVRGVNVPIYIIPPTVRRVGSFALKNVDPDTKKAASGTVTCDAVKCSHTVNAYLP